MKIICTQENLKTSLQVIGRVAGSSNTLPILNNVLLKTENGQLKLQATNLEVAISTYMRCKIEEEGSVTVVSKIINDLVNSLPNQNLTIQTADNNVLKIETENYHTTLKTLPEEEFPLIPSVENGYEVNLKAEDLKKSLDQVSFASSTNQTQPEITGVLFSIGKNLKLAATDRYRLAEKTLSIKGLSTEHQSILPHKTIQELSRIIGPQSGEARLVFNDTQMLFKFSGTEIISRLVDGQYPDYQQIIPTNFITEIYASKQQLIGALKTVAVFSQGNNSVKLEYSEPEQKLSFAAESSELGRSKVDRGCEIKGGAGSLILNYRYVLDCLGSMDGDEVVLKINNNTSPTLVVPRQSADYLYLVMPIQG